jgi:hypothetical protein
MANISQSQFYSVLGSSFADLHVTAPTDLSLGTVRSSGRSHLPEGLSAQRRETSLFRLKAARLKDRTVKMRFANRVAKTFAAFTKPTFRLKLRAIQRIPN